ncbi:putative Xylose binding protein transport system [Planktothrix serta PCC 8927]|uniref:Xylose binding protein transport system n=1 Tax=Planktothrix serta PCC 8927 TaxID=671068 RepID=A0A7Z9DY38_9CYAN|nr:sugar-binding protein [Planktothrix serta]VXD17843.1 putative Xylose binding protein transport system [Planktothrix serta PCC 8927]
MFRLTGFSLVVKPIVALFLVLLILTGGCSQFNQSSAKGCNKIAILLPETEPAQRWEGSDRRQLEEKITEKLAIQLRGQDLTLLYFNADGHANQQFKQANRAIEQGACILILGPSGDATKIVEKAKKKHIPVIAYDRSIDNGKVHADYYISFDSEYVGELQGEYIASQFEDLSKKNPYKLEKVNNKFVIINGDSDDNNSILLEKGLKKSLKGLMSSQQLILVGENDTDPEINIPGWKGEIAADKIEEILTKYFDLKIVWVANDGMANNIIEKLVNLRYKPGQILITGQDGTIGSLTKIREGWQSMTVCKDSKDIAEKTALLVEALFEDDQNKISKLLPDNPDYTDSRSYVSRAVYPVTIDNFKDRVSLENDKIQLENTCKGKK